MTKAVVPATTLPPEEAVYQIMLLPVTEISETFGFVALQNDWLAVPVGAAGVGFIVAVTPNLDVDSHPFQV